MVTPVALDSIGWQYYIVYAVIAACVPVSVYFFFPETMGRNLEEIELIFKESPSVFSTVKFAKNRPRNYKLDQGQVVALGSPQENGR